MRQAEQACRSTDIIALAGRMKIASKQWWVYIKDVVIRWYVSRTRPNRVK